MKKLIVTILIIIITTAIGCNNERQFLEVTRLSEYEKSNFIPTLEHKISDKKNSVYCVTLLYAWDKIRKEINQPFDISNQYIDLTLLNQSNSYVNVLSSNEYNSTGRVNGDKVSARAEFNKSLPFKIKLQSFENKLVFNNQKVASFGVTGYDSYEQLKIVEIVYYKNE